MGVSVRLSRNTRMYLPFWLAIPAYMIAGIVWLGIFAVLAVVWLTLTLCKLAGAGISAARRGRGGHRAAREAQRPEAVAAEQARLEEYRRKREDHDARTHRYRVTQCNLDALTGGEFTLEADGQDQVHIKLTDKSVTHFLSLKVGDIVQVTHAPGNAGIEEFWQLARANGATPRSRVKLTAADMAWLGLTTARSDSGGQPG